jgi:hypothetical protein
MAESRLIRRKKYRIRERHTHREDLEGKTRCYQRNEIFP